MFNPDQKAEEKTRLFLRQSMLQLKIELFLIFS
jgi:hypothetical protein